MESGESTIKISLWQKVKLNFREAFSEQFEYQSNDSDFGGDSHAAKKRGRDAYRYILLLLALVLFLFHVVIIIDVAGELIRREALLLAHFGQHAGRIALLGCFFVLFLAHLVEAAAWGLFFRGARLLPSVTEGVYFTAASITTLGYGDVVLKYPWRHLGTLIAITGVLMFGCSTAFLFLILQEVWKVHL